MGLPLIYDGHKRLVSVIRMQEMPLKTVTELNTATHNSQCAFSWAVDIVLTECNTSTHCLKWQLEVQWHVKTFLLGVIIIKDIYNFRPFLIDTLF